MMTQALKSLGKWGISKFKYLSIKCSPPLSTFFLVFLFFCFFFFLVNSIHFNWVFTGTMAVQRLCFPASFATKQLSSYVSSIQSLQSCPTLCDPMECSTPGLPVHHQLPEFIQTHVHRVSDAIQPSHPLSSPSLPALNLSQHQGLFKWVSSLHQVAKVL